MDSTVPHKMILSCEPFIPVLMIFATDCIAIKLLDLVMSTVDTALVAVEIHSQ
jgi:hypothetical protein